MSKPSFDFISMDNYNKEQLMIMLDAAREINSARILGSNFDNDFKEKYGLSVNELLQGKRVAANFLENSTRTNYSTRSAAAIAGANVDGFSNINDTSLKKGESWVHTAAMFQGYQFDVIAMRSKTEGLQKATAEFFDKNYDNMLSQYKNYMGMELPFVRPMIVNAGDGKHQHPTQCLLDLLTIYSIANHNLEKDIDSGINLALMNDLRYGRTISSLASVAPLFNFTLHLAYPDERFSLPDYKLKELEDSGVKVINHGDDFLSAMRDADFAYQTRPQKERMGAGEDLENIINKGRITEDMVLKLGDDAPFLMHPLPIDTETFEEIEKALDNHPKSIYNLQASMGIPARIAVMALGLGKMDVVGIEKLTEKNKDSKTGVSYDNIKLSTTSKNLDKQMTGYVRDGYVIDQIPTGYGRRLEGAMGLENAKDHGISVVPASNVDSKKYGDKDMLKIHFKNGVDYKLTDDQLEMIALLTEGKATVSEIKHGKVVNKYHLSLNDSVVGKVECSEANCVTNIAKEGVKPLHYVLNDDTNTVLKCGYCSTEQSLNHIKENNRLIYIKR